jgi:ATP-dependent RNA helicase DeaD
VTFQFEDLSAPLVKSVQAMGYENPTEIQSKTIPLLLDHEFDFVGQAQTGTGKTAAFLLPLLNDFNYNSKSVRALIITPTRELAQQVHKELQKFSSEKKVRSLCVYGGTGYQEQIKKLKKDNIQIVVGTPGRVIDLIEKNVLKLDQCSRLILDEADEMLNMGFIEDVEQIISYLSEDRKIWMFSATMPQPITKLIEKKFNQPMVIKSKESNKTNKNIKQMATTLNQKDFVKGLKLFLESKREYSCIVFCETRMETERVADSLNQYGIRAVSLQGDLSQAQRDFAIRKFKERKADILVCTDVASRGIDISHVTHVINMGLPRQMESYVHRIGRTGRGDNNGEALSFVTPGEVRYLSKIERQYGVQIEMISLPKGNLIKKIKIEKEIENMSKIKSSILEKGEEFQIDASFESFHDSLVDLDQEQLIKLFFTFSFNKELRKIDESLKISAIESIRDVGSRSRRRRSRSFDRQGGGSRDRSRDGSRRRSSSRGGSDSRKSRRSRGSGKPNRSMHLQ